MGVSVLRRHRRAVASTAIIAAAGAAIVAYALRSDGYPTRHVELNDGGIWVTSDTDGLFGRLNKPADTLDLALNPPGGAQQKYSLDVRQQSAAVVSWDQGAGKLLPVDVVTGKTLEDQAVPVADGEQVVVNGGTLAVVNPASNRVWAMRVDPVLGIQSLAAVDPSARPTAILTAPGATGSGAAVAVAGDGTVYGVGANGVVATIKPTDQGMGKPEYSKLSRTLRTVQATTVDNQLVVFDASTGTVLLPGGKVETVTANTSAVLQQQTPDSGSSVAIASPTQLIAVPLAGGDPKLWFQGTNGIPAPPTWSGDCLHAAWGGNPGVYVRKCGDDNAQRYELADRPSLQKPVFRVNRGLIVLNDLSLGSVYDLDTLQQVDDWSAVKPPPLHVQSDKDKNNTTAAATRNLPPKAVDDDLGARAGHTAVLHVLDNDSDPQASILSVTSVSNIDNTKAVVSIAPDGESINVTMPEDSSAVHFKYTIDDGQGLSAAANVSVVAHPTEENGKPALRNGFTQHAFAVTSGGSLDIPVLSDWRDPDSDSLVLTSAKVGAGTITTTPDGRVDYTAPANGSTQTIQYTLTDGYGASVTQQIPLTVLAADSTKTAAPVANPDTARGQVGQPVRIEPLANDLPGADPTNPGAVLTIAGNIASPAGATVSTDLKTGDVVITAGRPGTFLLSYTAAFGNAPFSKANVRVDIAGTPPTPAPPVAVPDTAIVYGQVASIVDVLSNDYDPAGGVLVVQRAAASEPTQVEVAIVDGHWLRIAAANPVLAPNPAVVKYTITDGQSAPVTGEVTVTQLDTPAEDTPVAHDDYATVRVGDSTAVPVLDNDIDPTGAPLALVGNVRGAPKPGQLTVRGLDGRTTGVGTAYVSGRLVRYIAPITLTQPLSVTVTYVLQNPSANQATGTANITVNPLPTPQTPDEAPAPQTVYSRLVSGDAVAIRIPTSGVDPDGDSATVVGIASAPKLGRVQSINATSIAYESFPTSSGTDSFTYILTDRFGRTAQGTVRVGIAQAGDPQPPVAVDDLITAAPGDHVQVDVTGNDVIAADDNATIRPLSEANPDLPGNAKLLAATGPLTVDAPAADGKPLDVLYQLTDGIGVPSVGRVSVRSISGYVAPPIAVDAFAKPQPNAATATVNVLENDSDPTSSRLAISAVFGAGTRVDGTNVIVPVLDHPQAIPYEIRNAKGGSAAAVIHVPARGVGAPYARPTAPIGMDVDGTTTIDIKDYVIDPAGKPVQLTLESQLFTAPADDLSIASTSKTGLKLTARNGYVGPAAIAFQVTDGTSINDPKGQLALITVSVQIGPVTPVIRCPSGSVNVVEGGAPTSINVTSLCHVWLPDRSQLGSLHYSASWQKQPLGVSITGNHSNVISLTASGSAKPGDVGVLTIGVDDTKAKTSTLSVTVLPLGPPRVAPIVIDGFKAGTTAVRDVRGYVTSPLRDPVVSVVSVQRVSGMPATAAVRGSQVTLTPGTTSHGVITFRIVVTDVADKTRADRHVVGSITMTVLNRPDPPGAPTAGRTVLSKSVSLSWPTPADNGAPIEYYKVEWSGGSQQCAASPCTITGLTNGSLYAFRVVAHNVVGDSDPSPALSPPAKPNAKPGAVGNLGASNPQDHAITLHWTPAPNEGTPVTRHQISWSGGGSASAPGNATSYTVSGLVNDNVYTFTVIAVNELGPGPSANTRGQSAGNPPAPPNMNVQYADQAGTDTRGVLVSWDTTDPNGPGPATYTVTRNQQTICNDVPRTSCQDTAPTGATYTYSVTAKNTPGHVGQPSTKQFVVAGTPGTVENMTAAPNGTDGQLTLHYTAPDPHGQQATMHCYWNGANSCGTWDMTGVQPGSAQTRTLTGFPYDTDVTITMAESNEQYTGESHNSATGHTDGPPHAPGGGSCGRNGDTVSWSWSQPSSINGHTVSSYQVTLDGNTFTVNGTSYQKNEPEDGQNRTASVKSIDNRGEKSTTANSITCPDAPKPDPPKIDVTMGDYHTDPDDCQYGCHYVHVVGSGWQPGQRVDYVITWSPATDPGNYHYTATADGNGNISQTPGPYYGGGNAGGDGHGTVTATAQTGNPPPKGSCYGDWKNGGGCTG